MFSLLFFLEIQVSFGLDHAIKVGRADTPIAALVPAYATNTAFPDSFFCVSDPIPQLRVFINLVVS